MAQVSWLPAAVDDLDAIGAYIAIDSRAHAQRFVEKVLAVAGDLEQFPRLGRRVPEWDDDDLRERIIFSYRLIYRLRGDAVEILGLIHGARMLPHEIRSR